MTVFIGPWFLWRLFRHQTQVVPLYHSHGMAVSIGRGVNEISQYSEKVKLGHLTAKIFTEKLPIDD